MLECRSPRFDGFGILSWINEELLSAFEGETETFMQGLWYTELYRMPNMAVGVSKANIIAFILQIVQVPRISSLLASTEVRGPRMLLLIVRYRAVKLLRLQAKLLGLRKNRPYRSPNLARPSEKIRR